MKVIIYYFSYGTNQFSVHVSLKSDSEWSLTLTRNLPDARNVACESIPLMVFDINRSGRYAKLTLDSFYHTGAGLQHVNFDFTEMCGNLKYMESRVMIFVV